MSPMSPETSEGESLQPKPPMKANTDNYGSAMGEYLPVVTVLGQRFLV